MLENFPLEVDIAAPPLPTPVPTLEAFPAESNVARMASRPESVPKQSPQKSPRRTHALLVVGALMIGGVFSIWHLNQGAPVTRIVTARASAQPAARPTSEPA